MGEREEEKRGEKRNGREIVQILPNRCTAAKCVHGMGMGAATSRNGTGTCNRVMEHGRIERIEEQGMGGGTQAHGQDRNKENKKEETQKKAMQRKKKRKWRTKEGQNTIK